MAKVDSNLAAQRVANAAKLREVERCLREDEPHPDAHWFTWGDGLFYGTIVTKSRGELRGSYVTIGEADFCGSPGGKKILSRIASVMNDRDTERRNAAAGF